MVSPLHLEARTDHLAETRAAFADAVAARAGSVHESRLRFGGRPVLLRAVGPALAEQLARCFEVEADDRADPRPAHLTVHAWDRAHTGVGCPGIPHAPDSTAVLGPGLVHQYGGGRVVRYDRPDIVKALDRATGDLFLCVTDASRAGLSDLSKPFPHLLATWYFDQGIHILHAGLVADRGRGVLIGGAAGAGKSTTTLACALAGFDVLGDDAVGTEIASDRCVGHACYSTVRFDEGTLRRLPRLAEHSLPPTAPADRGKHLAYVVDVLGHRPNPEASLEAIVMPTVAGAGATRLVEARGSTTLRRLAPSTLLRGLGGGSAGMAHMGELVRRLPSYELHVGDRLDDIPAVLHDLLVGLAP